VGQNDPIVPLPLSPETEPIRPDRTAFVLDRRPHREQDLRVTLLTEHGARVDAVALNAQRSKRRFMGALSPLVLYRVRYSTTPKATRLDEAQVEQVWPGLSRALRSQTAALAATGIVRAVAEPTPHDGALFLLLGELYTAAAASDDRDALAGRLVRFAFEVLDHTGHAIALDRCVRCDTPAPDGARVTGCLPSWAMSSLMPWTALQMTGSSAMPAPRD